VNLDFSSEADMVDKVRLGIALQPIATALFANSPFRNGAPTGYLSWRSHVWTDTDPDRCCSRAPHSRAHLGTMVYALYLYPIYPIPYYAYGEAR
jgi:glutamate--cysteine ligase